MSKYWSDFVAGLDPYVPGEQPKVAGLIKLNTNESPYPPSPRVHKAITAAAIDQLRLYPDPNSQALKEAIAHFNGISAEQVFVGNGSDEVLAHVFMALFKHSAPLLYPDISYSFYPVYANLYGIQTVTPALTADYEINFADYHQANGGIIFPNPNAPTSIAKPLAEIEALLQANTESVVVVDEAYIDFGGVSAVSLIDRFENLLVVQTVSKSRSLAGSRVGFAMGHPVLIDALNRVKNSFNSYPIDRLAELATVAAFEDVDYFNECRDRIIRTRNWTTEQLQGLDFDVLPSCANFVFAKPNSMSAKSLFGALRDRKILVRYFDKPRLNEFLRISIGTDAEMQALIEAIIEVKGKV